MLEAGGAGTTDSDRVDVAQASISLSLCRLEFAVSDIRGESRQSTVSTSEVGKFPTRKLSISHGNTLVPDTEKTIFNNPANSQDLQNSIAEEDEENDQ